MHTIGRQEHRNTGRQEYRPPDLIFEKVVTVCTLLNLSCCTLSRKPEQGVVGALGDVLLFLERSCYFIATVVKSIIRHQPPLMTM